MNNCLTETILVVLSKYSAGKKKKDFDVLILLKSYRLKKKRKKANVTSAVYANIKTSTLDDVRVEAQTAAASSQATLPVPFSS